MASVKNWVLGIAILILTISVGVYGISTLYGKGPQYNDICPNRQIFTEQECVDAEGIWSNYSQDPKAVSVPIGQQGYCDTYTKCQAEYDNAERDYTRNIFLIALPLGIIIIIIGGVVFGLEAVGGGLMFGGVGIILYGVGGFWRYADDWLKFVLSLIGLIIVIGIAYYINKKWNLGLIKNKKKK